MNNDLIFALITLAVWATLWLTDQRDPWTSKTLAFWAVWYGTLATFGMIFTNYHLTMVANGAFAAWLAYLAWKRRKPRQRKPSKATGLVRDLGHRLVVSAT